MKFKTERHQLNYNLHRLAIKAVGPKDYRQLLNNMIVEQLSQRDEVPSVQGDLSCKLLTDREAINILIKLKRITRPGYKHTNQDKLIIRLAKYKFGWSGEAIFNYILESVPEIRKRLTNYELRHPKLNTLFRVLNIQQKDKVIKRLIMIESKNKIINKKQQ